MPEDPKDPHTVRAVRPARISTAGGAPAPVDDPGDLIVEAPLTLDVQGVGAYTIMCAPENTVALAVGFLFAEGIIDGPQDIGVLQRCEDDPGVLRVRLAENGNLPEVRNLREGAVTRNLLIVSSCGLCGSRSIGEMLAALPRVGEELVVRAPVPRLAIEAMRQRQSLFRRTGGTHAAALFDRRGALVSFAEDIGRHNALDKAIGACLLEGRSPAGCGAALSGRVSLELVAKCARAGLELIAAVSAPTSLALDAARRASITLCAFVRGERATVYCHPQRVVGLQGGRGDPGERR